ncbi:hypothetical protein [Pedobacter sp. B4-66]|uniref:hypothetical protein n=1 Tax=Pedobacter sp. B4-66 TaxID=2817280 RepID=UPI001BDB459C|nr:hypothetical protein [Pedobacter sp. B4-66]
MELFAPENFKIIVEGITATVTEHNVGDQQLFRIEFEDGRNPLNVIRASTVTGKMWMSIPQGRLKEAELAGQQISEYFKNKK